MRFKHSEFEEELWIVPVFCDKNKIALDAGANLGVYAYYLAKFSRGVVAFEPNTNFTVHLKRLLGRRARIEPVALSATTGRAFMRIDDNQHECATIEQNNCLSWADGLNPLQTKSVDIRPLDSYNFTNVAMIKIDVEGHEEAVIDGAQDTIRRNLPVLLIESEDRHNPGAPKRLAKRLAALGYEVYYIKDNRLMDFSALSVEDTNLANCLRDGRNYINNFIFIPKMRSELVNDLARALSGQRRHNNPPFN